MCWKRCNSRIVRDLDSIIWERVSPPADGGGPMGCAHGENAVALLSRLRMMRDSMPCLDDWAKYPMSSCPPPFYRCAGESESNIYWRPERVFK